MKCSPLLRVLAWCVSIGATRSETGRGRAAVSPCQACNGRPRGDATIMRSTAFVCADRRHLPRVETPYVLCGTMLFLLLLRFFAVRGQVCKKRACNYTIKMHVRVCNNYTIKHACIACLLTKLRTPMVRKSDVERLRQKEKAPCNFWSTK